MGHIVKVFSHDSYASRIIDASRLFKFASVVLKKLFSTRFFSIAPTPSPSTSSSIQEYSFISFHILRDQYHIHNRWEVATSLAIQPLVVTSSCFNLSDHAVYSSMDIYAVKSVKPRYASLDGYYNICIKPRFNLWLLFLHTSWNFAVKCMKAKTCWRWCSSEIR